MARKIDIDAVLTQIKIGVQAYGLGFMANELNKAYSTFANQLNEDGTAKLGFRDSLRALEILLFSEDTNDQAIQAALNAIDLIEDGISRVAYKIPDPPGDKMTSEMLLVSRLSKKFSTTIKDIAESIEDCKWEKDEIDQCIIDIKDLLIACLQINSFLNRLRKIKSKEVCA